MIPSLRGDSYEEKLRELNLMSLESRRNRTDMVTTYKILTGKDNVDPGTWFEMYGTLTDLPETHHFHSTLYQVQNTLEQT